MTTEVAAPRREGWTPDDSTFGARLALVRQRMSWGNVKEAAIACDLPPESWRRWERDGITPRNIVEVSAIIAGATGCDRMWLLLGPDGVRRLYAEATNGPKTSLRKVTSQGRPSPERPTAGRPPRPRIHKLPVAV